MEWLLAKVGIEVVQWTVGGVSAVLVAWLFKKIPNNKIKAVIGTVMYSAGIACTLGLSKWKYTKSFWNKVIEPWLIDFIDNVFNYGVEMFIKGLRSDNIILNKEK